MKVLIADNHEVVQVGLKLWLKNWTIFEATNADEAIKVFRKQRPDLVVIESRLPGDGLNCLARLKLDYPETPALMFSGDTNPTYIARARALGASGLRYRGTD